MGRIEELEKTALESQNHGIEMHFEPADVLQMIDAVKAADAMVEKLEQGSWQLEAASEYRQARAKIEGE